MFTWLWRPGREKGRARNNAGAEAGTMNECYSLAYFSRACSACLLIPTRTTWSSTGIAHCELALLHQSPIQKMLCRHAIPTSRSEDNSSNEAHPPPQIHLDCLEWTETNHSVNSTRPQIRMANTSTQLHSLEKDPKRQEMCGED